MHRYACIIIIIIIIIHCPASNEHAAHLCVHPFLPSFVWLCFLLCAPCSHAVTAVFTAHYRMVDKCEIYRW
jgi:hypothetical protein